MDALNRNSVLFVCKDNVYTKALAIILNLTFKTDVHVESETDAKISEEFTFRQLNYIIVDLHSYSEHEIEKAISFKSEYPQAKLIGLQKDDMPVKFPNYIFDEIIFKRHFYLGFSSIMKKNAAERPKLPASISPVKIVKKATHNTNFTNSLFGIILKKTIKCNILYMSYNFVMLIIISKIVQK